MKGTLAQARPTFCSNCGDTFLRRYSGVRHCSLACRLISKFVIDEATGCWMWTAALSGDGYGTYGGGSGKGPSGRSHRTLYELLVGPVPDELHIDHLCRTRACCNPDHLEPVTPRENARRGGLAITHCPQGHKYTPENTYTSPRGHRVCRRCKQAEARGRWERIKAARASVGAA